MTAGVAGAPVAAGTDLVAAVDIGGTKTAAALVDGAGGVLARSSASTPGAQGPAAVLRVAADLVADVRAGVEPGRVRALGVGSAGVVDPATGRILSATDAIADWAGTDVRGVLGALTELRTTVLNDVHAHGLGESRWGSGRGVRTLLLLAVGTGVGSALVVDGRVLAGAHGVAGHAGHQPSPYAGRLACSCGRAGHLEAIASGPALVAEYRRRGGNAVADLRGVATAAATGDPLAAEVLALGGAAVGSAVGGLLNLLDPDVVVVGGGVAGVGRSWWDALLEQCGRDALPAVSGTPVLPSELGGDAALLGAAAAAREVAA